MAPVTDDVDVNDVSNNYCSPANMRKKNCMRKFFCFGSLRKQLHLNDQVNNCKPARPPL